MEAPVVSPGQVSCVTVVVVVGYWQKENVAPETNGIFKVSTGAEAFPEIITKSVMPAAFTGINFASTQ